MLEKAAQVDALLLDDLGKNRMTERAEVELYDLLEHRTGHLLPTFWTSNSNAAGLHDMFSPDRADAMLRRLGKEFCEHVTL
jgi:DNA replication protein DnaC